MNGETKTEDLLSLPAQPHYEEPEASWRQLSAAEGYGELGMFAEAHRELDSIDQTAGYRLDIAERKLDLFLAEKRWKDAAIYGEILTEFEPDTPEHFVNYATALHALGRTDVAIYALSLAPQELERDPDCQYRLAGYELEAGTREEALFHLENAVALKPELREVAGGDSQLAGLVGELPDEPRFVPSQPEYIPEPGEEEFSDFDDAPDSPDDLRCHEVWGVPGLEIDVFGDCIPSTEDQVERRDADPDAEFDCPF